MLARLGNHVREALLLLSLPLIALLTLYLIAVAFWAGLIALAALVHRPGLLVLPFPYMIVPLHLWDWAHLPALNTLPGGMLRVLNVGQRGYPKLADALRFIHTGGLRTVIASWPYVTVLALLWLVLGFRYQAKWVALFAHLNRRRDPAPDFLQTELAALAARAQLPPPRLNIWAEGAPNAFATGLSPATYEVTVTAGLLRTLNTPERQAVLAHELGHIARGDVRLATLCHVYGGIFASLGGFFWHLGVDSLSGAPTRYNRIFFTIPIALLLGTILSLAGGLSTLVRLILLRGRELAADAFSKKLLGGGAALAAALTKIDGWQAPVPHQKLVRESVIVRQASRGWLGRLVSTHPTLARRVKALLPK